MAGRAKLGWGLWWVCLSACGGPFGDGGFPPFAGGGANGASGGAEASTGGSPASMGGAEVGGSPANTGGAEVGGSPESNGGSPANTGGAEVGGSPESNGGSPANAGGSPANTGGAEAGIGGSWSATPEEPPLEGTRCLTSDHCGAGLYCRRPAGQCFGFGHCAAAPADCGPGDPPVCTCSGEAAENRCAAGAAGENVAFAGACGVACGWGQPCPGDQICHPGPNRVQDFGGFCGPPPSDCGADNPVCGADGRAHPNECAALANGGWIETLGPCGACASADDCWTGADGFECRDVCVRPAGRCDEVVFGTCRLECGHDMCAWQAGNGDPVAVCGCDGRDYPAACEAEWVGARVSHEGACGGEGP